MGLRSRIRTALTPVPVERGVTWPAEWMNFGGRLYPLGLNQTLVGTKEEIGQSFSGYTSGAYQGNGVVFACLNARMSLFKQATWMWQKTRSGVPGELWSSPALDILRTPWPNGTTGDLMARMIQDADLAGNSFTLRRPGRLVRLRPDWVVIMHGSPNDPEMGMWDPDAELLGYWYRPGGSEGGRDWRLYQPPEIAHFAPVPDPLAPARGMSWLTPLVREIEADSAATSHKLAYFRNGATPNLVVTGVPAATPELYTTWVEKFSKGHDNSQDKAYKTMYLSGTVDAKVVGSDLAQVDFKVTQGAGEPLALDTPIPTPHGWTTMGDIEPGDQVFGRDGKPATVTGASPVHGGRDCYRVTFSDKTSIVADGGHLWLAMDRNTATRAEQTYTTDELRALIDEWEARGIAQANRIGIPAGAPVELPARDLLLDPYVLGVWLGDGATAGAAVSGATPDLDIIAQEIERRGYTVTRWATRPDKVAVIGLPGGVLAALDALGVLGGKFIPADYLRASHAQRLDLLRGLMDTDGTVGHVGKESCEYSSKLERLARQVAELARSLGYRVTVSRKLDARSRTGETWRVTFRADPDVVPFHLPRKAERVVTPVHVKNRAIVSIERVESVPVRCIAVNTPDHLFRAGEGWTLTHNTRIAAAAGVPPIVVGLSEGLQGSSLNAGNFQAAMRRFADLTGRSLWQDAAGALSSILTVPGRGENRLWYDDRYIPALKDDIKDAAEVQAKQAQAIRQYVDAGFEPGSVVDAINAGDLKRLKHSGLYSVQLQLPVPEQPEPAAIPEALTPFVKPTAQAEEPANE